MQFSSEFVCEFQSTDNNPQLLAPKKILLLERELYLTQALLASNNEESYSMTQAFMGQTFNKEINKYLIDARPDMVVFYIGCNEHEDLAFISTIRNHFNGLLMVVTSNNCEKEHYKAFELGANDYLCRPIDDRILSKHIESLFARQPKQPSAIELVSTSMGGICLQPHSQKCFINGAYVKLTNFEFKLLSALIEHEGTILSRDMLYTTLFKRTYNGVERTIDVRMSQLREKLTMAGMKGSNIETVWGQGYMLSLNVTS